MELAKQLADQLAELSVKAKKLGDLLPEASLYIFLYNFTFAVVILATWSRLQIKIKEGYLNSESCFHFNRVSFVNVVRIVIGIVGGYNCAIFPCVHTAAPSAGRSLSVRTLTFLVGKVFCQYAILSH